VRVALVGAGAVGVRAARQLLSTETVESIVVIHRRPSSMEALAGSLGPRVEARRGGPDELPDGLDVVVVTTPSGARRVAENALERGAHVVAAVDDPQEVRRLIALDGWARQRGRTVAIGTAMAPGLSCVLARFAARKLDRVEEIHVASLGTGGPACARRHHAALSSIAVDYSEGTWRRRAGGSGRELVWFPEPVGGADCYRAGLADPLLLVPAFPEARRITARLSASRRDRMTAWLPMLRPPHPEGTVGAVRVEVRGWRDGMAETVVYGAVARPALAAGTVAALTASWLANDRVSAPGAMGLALLVGDPAQFLRELGARGITVSAFEGNGSL
jgi:saccharopine dehydrogenase-like NADP-dependent oxidoreductase